MFAYCYNNPVNCIDPTGENGLYLSSSLMTILSGALGSLIISITSAMASIKAAIASALIPVICIAVAAVGIAALS